MNIKDLEPLIVKWAKDKELILHTQEQALKQHGKTKEEVSELLEAIAVYRSIEDVLSEGHPSYEEGDADDALEAVKLESGDVLVTLVIQCAIAQGPDFERVIEDIGEELAWPNMPGEAMQQIMMSAGIDNELVWVACGQLALWVERAIAPYNISLDEALEATWLKIRDRQGKTVDGVFVKDGVAQ